MKEIRFVKKDFVTILTLALSKKKQKIEKGDSVSTPFCGISIHATRALKGSTADSRPPESLGKKGGDQEPLSSPDLGGRGARVTLTFIAEINQLGSARGGKEEARFCPSSWPRGQRKKGRKGCCLSTLSGGEPDFSGGGMKSFHFMEWERRRISKREKSISGRLSRQKIIKKGPVVRLGAYAQRGKEKGENQTSTRTDP